MIEIGYFDDTARVTSVQRIKTSNESPDSIKITAADLLDVGNNGDDFDIATNGETIIRYNYDGPYITKVIQTLTSDTGVSASLKFDYSYDAYFRQTQRKGTLNGQSVATDSWQYGNGKLTAFGRYSISYPATNERKIYSSSSLQISEKHDGNGRLIEKTLQVNSKTVFSLKLSYDNASRVATRELSVGTVVNKFQYVYDLDKRLTEVWQDGKRVEKYSYDDDGNLNAWEGLKRQSASFDGAGRVTSAGNTMYVWNTDGLLSRRGTYSYKYTARGELLSVEDTQTAKTAVSFTYDGYGRRASRTEFPSLPQGPQSTLYFYGDLRDPYRITHVVTNSGTVQRSLRYDPEGNLFAIEGSNTRYVATDELGTPRALFDTSGKLIKHVTYNAIGETVSDTMPDETFYIGFSGGILDPTTSFVRTRAGDYDPLSGQFVSYNPSQMDLSTYNKQLSPLFDAMADARLLLHVQHQVHDLVSTSISDHSLSWIGERDLTVLPGDAQFTNMNDQQDNTMGWLFENGYNKGVESGELEEWFNRCGASCSCKRKYVRGSDILAPVLYRYSEWQHCCF